MFLRKISKASDISDILRACISDISQPQSNTLWFKTFQYYLSLWQCQNSWFWPLQTHGHRKKSNVTNFSRCRYLLVFTPWSIHGTRPWDNSQSRCVVSWCDILWAIVWIKAFCWWDSPENYLPLKFNLQARQKSKLPTNHTKNVPSFRWGQRVYKRLPTVRPWNKNISPKSCGAFLL